MTLKVLVVNMMQGSYYADHDDDDDDADYDVVDDGDDGG